MIPLLILLCLALPVAAQQPKPVDLAEDPTASLLLENEYARVWRIEVAPMKRGAYHEHSRDYVMVTLDGADTVFARPEPQTYEHLTSSLRSGDTRFLRGGIVHQVRNVGVRGTLILIVVEALRAEVRPRGPYDYDTLQAHLHDSFGASAEPEKSFHLTHISPAMLASKDHLTPGDSTAVHEHRGPHLVIPLTDFELRSEPAGGGEPQTLTASKGDVQWVEAGGRHKLTNVGSQPARWITLEFK